MKKLAIVFTFMCASIGGHAQRFEEYVKVMGKIPDLFLGWIENIQKLPDQQDKEKFTVICKDIYFNIDQLSQKKKGLLAALNQDIAPGNYSQLVFAFSNQARELAASLKRSEDLSKKMTGVSAMSTINELQHDIGIKELLLNDTQSSSGASKIEKKNKVKANLTKGIETLDQSKIELTKLLSILETK